jgi:hypothetical protein
LWGGSRVPPSGPTSTPPPIGATPAYGGPPPAAGLGAALAGDYAGQQANGGSYNPHGTHANTANSPGATSNGTNGRSLPAWYDLTGAGGNEPVAGGTMPGAPSDADPLPQRRPGQWSDSDAEGGPSAESGFAGFGLPATAPPSLPAGPTSPSAFVGGAPAAGRPPAWPPVSDPAADYPADAVPDIPQGLSASLDMTSELPRMRSAPPIEAAPAQAGYPRPDMSAAPAGYSDDMTMELPIFRELELESAWFRREQPSSPPQESAHADYARDSWSPQAPGDEAYARSAGYASSAPQRADWSTGSDTVERAEDAVSWRSVADDGWLAAQAALDPRDGGSTERGLPRRVPMAQLVPGGVEVSAGVPERGAPDRRTPDSVRGLLSAYHRGVKRGRDAHGKDAGPTSTDSQNSGREQEA